jgi:hypothetical protein
MSRTAVSLSIADLSSFAKSLRDQLAKVEQPPGHVEILNMLCRSAGFRNYQHCKGVLEAGHRLQLPPAAAAPIDYALVERAARSFDEHGRLLRWPTRPSLQTLALWVLWSRLPSRIAFTEKQISERLQAWHVFGDHALLRRALVDWHLLRRTHDGSEYRRIEQRPPVELGKLLRRLQSVSHARLA